MVERRANTVVASADAIRQEDTTGKVRFQVAMSLDGYIAGPDQSEANPLGIGGMDFFFVTDGIGSALAQARDAAGALDVAIGGGASVLRQSLAVGLVDEFELHVVPTLLGAGERPLDGLGDIKIEQVRVLEAPGVAHLKYRVTR